MKIIIYFIITFLFLFYPTSTDGIIRDTISNIVFDWALVFLVLLVVLSLYGKLDLKNAIISLIILIYLTLVTFISSSVDTHSTFSLARVAPICLFLLLASMKVNINISMHKLFIFFDILMLVIIVVNILILLQNDTIMNFIVGNYSQLYENATENMFIKQRPIFTFGVYTFASYFYILLFLLSFYTYIVTNKYKYNIFCYILLIFNIFLASNFSIISSLCMVSILSTSIFKKGNHYEIIVFFLFISILVIWLINNKELTGYYMESITSEHNGVIGRYSSVGSLAVNNEYLETYPNIGFNIIRNIKLTYTDSGYFVFRLMGGWILLFPCYYLFYRFMKNNLERKYLIVFLLTLLFELALPVLIYIKFAYAMFFFIIYMSSLRKYEILSKMSNGAY